MGGMSEVAIPVIIEAVVVAEEDKRGAAAIIMLIERGIRMVRIEGMVVGGVVGMRGQVMAVVIVIGEIIVIERRIRSSVRDIIMVVVIEVGTVLAIGGEKDITVVIIMIEDLVG